MDQLATLDVTTTGEDAKIVITSQNANQYTPWPLIAVKDLNLCAPDVSLSHGPENQSLGMLVHAENSLFIENTDDSYDLILESVNLGDGTLYAGSSLRLISARDIAVQNFSSSAGNPANNGYAIVCNTGKVIVEAADDINIYADNAAISAPNVTLTSHGENGFIEVESYNPHRPAVSGNLTIPDANKVSLYSNNAPVVGQNVSITARSEINLVTTASALFSEGVEPELNCDGLIYQVTGCDTEDQVVQIYYQGEAYEDVMFVDSNVPGLDLSAPSSTPSLFDVTKKTLFDYGASGLGIWVPTLDETGAATSGTLTLKNVQYNSGRSGSIILPKMPVHLVFEGENALTAPIDEDFLTAQEDLVIELAADSTTTITSPAGSGFAFADGVAGKTMALIGDGELTLDVKRGYAFALVNGESESKNINSLHLDGGVLHPDADSTAQNGNIILGKTILPSGSTLQTNQDSNTTTITSTGGFVNNGDLILHNQDLTSDEEAAAWVKSLNMEGKGVVTVHWNGSNTATTSTGELVNQPGTDRLDFTNVGDGTGQTPAEGNGYSWDADTNTLTITSLLVLGVTLPQNATLVLEGESTIYTLAQDVNTGSDLNTLTITSTDKGSLNLFRWYHTQDFTLKGNAVLLLNGYTLGIDFNGPQPLPIENFRITENATLDSEGPLMAYINNLNITGGSFSTYAGTVTSVDQNGTETFFSDSALMLIRGGSDAVPALTWGQNMALKVPKGGKLATDTLEQGISFLLVLPAGEDAIVYGKDNVPINGAPEVQISKKADEPIYDDDPAPSTGGGGGGKVTPGTKKDVTTLPDGTVITTETNEADQTQTVTTVRPDGSKTVEETKKDGSKTITDTLANGTEIKTTIDPKGKAQSKVTLPAGVNEAPVTVPADLGETDGQVDVTVTYPDGATETLTGLYANGKVRLTVKNGAILQVGSELKPTALPFTDVAADDWFRSGVAFVYARGLFFGTTVTEFSPNTPMTREMLWMVLARLDGQAPATMDAARTWAMENGVSDGSNPQGNITREQLVSILYRYAQKMGYDTTQGGMAIREFNDFTSIADYAMAAMTWSVNTGLIHGSDNNVMPQGNATRAQVAAILMRFVTQAAIFPA